jgi:predicted nucleotide-binding protein
MDKLQLLRELQSSVRDLPYADRGRLDSLRRRAEMVIRKVFGPESKYLTDLSGIHFFPMVYPADEDYYQESWRDGKQSIMNLVATMIEELELFGLEAKAGGERQSPGSTQVSSDIFVVHGHDEEMKHAAARVLEKLGLRAIILHEQADQGRTIIEKFTDLADVGFAVVLLSPDDIAHSRHAPPEEAKYRARQNVIFELGFFVGKLGRNRVSALHRVDPKFEMPTDYSGVLFTPFDAGGKWQFDLARELKAAGYEIDLNTIV